MIYEIATLLYRVHVELESFKSAYRQLSEEHIALKARVEQAEYRAMMAEDLIERMKALLATRGPL